jgi:hypothetical protein
MPRRLLSSSEYFNALLEVHRIIHEAQRPDLPMKDFLRLIYSYQGPSTKGVGNGPNARTAALLLKRIAEARLKEEEGYEKLIKKLCSALCEP